jgi:hypothetical protein
LCDSDGRRVPFSGRRISTPSSRWPWRPR